MAKAHSKLVQDTIKHFNSLPNSHAFPYTPSPYGKRSVSDIICCHRGHHVAIEIKIGKDTPTPLQKVHQRKIQAAQGFARVCWSMEEVKEFIEFIDKIIEQ
ncbi:unnamed protein product [marine sediment metagenome]|uniref:VRR-NUC domain-containing protein n=1 Tax=marine sediment metagenome TaxID=412755 RepID=X0XWU7_9ZZZZ